MCITVIVSSSEATPGRIEEEVRPVVVLLHGGVPLFPAASLARVPTDRRFGSLASDHSSLLLPEVLPEHEIHGCAEVVESLSPLRLKQSDS